MHESCTAAEQHAGTLPSALFPSMAYLFTLGSLVGYLADSQGAGGHPMRVRRVCRRLCAWSTPRSDRVEVTAQCARVLCTCWLPSAHAHVRKATHSLALVRPSLLSPRVFTPSVPHHGGSQTEMTATCVREERYHNAATHHLTAHSPPRYPHTHIHKKKSHTHRVCVRVCMFHLLLHQASEPRARCSAACANFASGAHRASCLSKCSSSRTFSVARRRRLWATSLR